MQDYDLSDAVSGLSHYSSATGTLWGIYAVATFTASGFGVSMGQRFTSEIAIFLAIGFVAFAIGHYFLLCHHIQVQQTISADIQAYLGRTKRPPTHFRRSVEAISKPDNNFFWASAAHLIIDLCVLFIIWKTIA